MRAGNATRVVLMTMGWLAASHGLSPSAAADPDPVRSEVPSVPVAVTAPTSDTANPVAVSACGQFADVLDASALYYGDFADSLDSAASPGYSDPALNSTNTLGRTALRQGAATAMSAANLPGLPPSVAAPMRTWSIDATKLLIKMGLHGGRDTLNVTADELNNDALVVQQSCAAEGTHA